MKMTGGVPSMFGMPYGRELTRTQSLELRTARGTDARTPRCVW